MEPDGEHPISDDNRRQVIRQVTKLVSGEGVHYASPAYGWPDDVIFRKDEPVTMQSDAVPNQFRVSRHRRDDFTGLISARSSRTRATSRTSTAATTATAGS
jgi:hypothetical protein